MKIDGIDHLVLTVRDLDTTCDFYRDIFGMQIITFAEGRRALRFGNQKINLHEAGNEFEPKAKRPTPGSADICFVTQTPLAQVINHLNRHSVTIVAGPIARTGAAGPIRSVYLRDPDENLIEISNYSIP